MSSEDLEQYMARIAREAARRASEAEKAAERQRGADKDAKDGDRK